MKAVLYFDGGCDKDGVGGYGIHGYLYTADTPTSGYGCGSAQPTSRGYSDTVKKAAKKPEVTITDWVDIWSGGLLTTNNQQELLAATRALTLLIEENVKTAYLWGDSEYVLKGITKWVKGWVANNWMNSRGEPVENRSYWEHLLALETKLIESGATINWEWVKGHSDDTGNDEADANATRGKLLARKGIFVERCLRSPAKGYWNPTKEVNRMFSKPRWYFNTGKTFTTPELSSDGRVVYYLGFHGKEDHALGKRISDNDFSVIFCAEEEPVLESIRRFQTNNSMDKMYSVVVGRLDNIMATDNYLDIATNGDETLRVIGDKTDVYNYRKNLITEECRPPRLAYRSIDNLNILKKLLEEYLVKDAGIVITDITDLLYTTVTSKKGDKTTLNKSITQTLKKIDQQVAYNTKGSEEFCDVTLTIGNDIADRNTLSALAERNPKVSVITWRESNIAFRYATVIEAGGDVGIWAGIFSNLRILAN